MKVKVNDATLIQLNWMVAKCEGLCEGDFAWYYDRRDTFKYSTDWAQGGPIIEQERIEIDTCGSDWRAVSETTFQSKTPRYYGPTALVAAMRCYVASCLGDEVEIPDELI